MTLDDVIERVKDRLWSPNPLIRYGALKLNIVTDKNRNFELGDELIFIEYDFKDNIARKNEFIYKIGEE